MDKYIKAVEEIGFVKNEQQHSGDHIAFHQKGVELVLQNCCDQISIFTEKNRHAVITASKEYTIYNITSQQIPLAIRAIVRFWAKNGVKLGKEKK